MNADLLPHRRRRTVSALLLTASLAACGGSSDPDDTGTDAGGDSSSGDVTIDTIEADTGDDAGDDATDAATDPASDPAADVAPDVAQDVAPDVVPDVVPDTAVDSGLDTAADATTDPAPDTTTDVGVDTAPDAPSDADVAEDTLPDAIGPDGVVDWCRLQFPTTIEGYPGDEVLTYGRVFEEGITTRTTGTDVDAELVAQVGVGPDGSDPAVDTSWIWVDADANPGWSDGAEPGNDEYQGTLTVPAPGAWDFAYRFSADGGASWLFCDRRAAADGAEDGYQPANAGAITSFDACVPDPCGTPPGPSCADAATLVTFAGPASCTAVGATPSCAFAETLTPCSEGDACVVDACVPVPRAPTFGEVIITEIMPQSRAGSDPGEWFEVYNTTDGTLDLFGCTIGEDGAPQDTVDTLLSLEPGAYAVFGANADTAVNGGVLVDFDWSGFGLTNTGDVIVLTCADEVVDVVEYAASDVVLGQSIQLDIARYDADSNDVPSSWCGGNAEYAAGLLGSPGTDNRSCALPTYAIDWCRLQFPLDVSEYEGTNVDFYGRVYIAGLTDRTAGIDEDVMVTGEVGYGPAGTMPEASWTWFTGVPNLEYAGDEPSNDEYVATLTMPPAGKGTWDVAFRFTGDDGEGWTYCDRNAGTGSDGAEDGYQLENAGTLVSQVAPDPCDPNPCDTPDIVASCVDGVTAAIPVIPGDCTAEGISPVCAYTTATEDCSLDGGVCIDGGCVTLSPQPGAGDVIITEVMAQSRAGADPGEWFELYNTTLGAFDLSGCTLSEVGGAVQHTIAGSLPIDSGAYLVMIADANPDVNGGIDGGYDFGAFALRNTGDSIVLTCGGVDVDTFEYTAGNVALGVAIQRSNDAFGPGATIDDWCPATEIYGTGLSYGTPGAPNWSCNIPPVTIDWCRLQFPLDVTAYEGTDIAYYGQVYVAGLTDASPGVDRYPALRAQLGWGADGTDPAADASWTFVEAFANAAWDGSGTNNDEYTVTIASPPLDGAPWDAAFRFSGDAGETWTYCDGNAGTGSDGAEDGYQPENAGTINVLANPCDPNPCLEAPAPVCEGADAVLVATAPGSCSIVDNAPSCQYAEATVPCDAGTSCADGACVPEPTFDIGWCVLQFPTTISAATGDTITVYGQVYAAGLTDRSSGVDNAYNLRAELGWGPSSTDPSITPDGWSWTQAAGNPGWNDAVAPNNDEYQADLLAPPPIDGDLSYAYRFTGDGGASWSYCDTGAGLSDGFSIVDAGTLDVFLP